MSVPAANLLSSLSGSKIMVHDGMLMPNRWHRPNLQVNQACLRRCDMGQRHLKYTTAQNETAPISPAEPGSASGRSLCLCSASVTPVSMRTLSNCCRLAAEQTKLCKQGILVEQSDGV